MKLHDFDPQKPFIASDGLEYACAADKLLDTPIDNWRNRRIQAERAHGASEKAIRDWVRLYDGDDPSHATLTSLATIAAVARYSHQPRADGAGPGQAPADPVHPADQPPLPRWLGP